MIATKNQEKTSSDVRSFTLAEVATGIKHGVSTIPCNDTNEHTLARLSFLLTIKENIVL